MRGDEMENQLSEPQVAPFPQAYENRKSIQVAEMSSIPELSFLCSPSDVPRRQRSKMRVIHQKATTVDYGFSGEQIVQEHPGPMLSTSRARPRARQKRSKKVAEDSRGSEGRAHHIRKRFSGEQIVQEHPGPMLSTSRARQKRSKKVAEDSRGSEGRAHHIRKSKKFAEDSSDSEQTVPCSFHCRGQTKRRVENIDTQQQGKLDDDIFDKYLGNLWRSIPSEKKDSSAYLDCLWFTMYAKESSRGKVLSWIKREKIFSKKYVFLPICKWSHWSLLIFCHLGENLLSKTKTPCMILLDSLHTAEPKRLEPEIRKFLWAIFKAEERQETKKLIYKIPLLVPKVPQQRDDKECGKYVLYYLNLFLMSAPETFNISEGYPYFMKEDWFTAEGLESFCKTLDSSDQ